MKVYRVTSDSRLLSIVNTKDAFYIEYFGDYTPQIERFFTDLDEAKAFYDSIEIGEAEKRSGTVTVYVYEAKMLEWTDADDDSDEETLEYLFSTGLCSDLILFDCSDPYRDSEPDEDEDDDDEDKNMKKELNYRWTANYNDSFPNNNYSDFIDTVIFDSENYDFSDYLSDRNICFDFCEMSNEYIIVDEDGEPTGERYQIVSEKLLRI